MTRLLCAEWSALAAGLSARHLDHTLPISRYLIMAEIAVPEGKVIKPGSACFKSVSGLDIVKILALNFIN